MFKRAIKSILLFPLWAFSKAFNLYDAVLSNIFPQLKGVGRQKLIDYIDNDINLTKHDSTNFQLYTPNRICNFRHTTFSTKEPEMLEWIEEYGGGVFFDIGANIGIYSLFYAQVKEGNVYSFEPSVFNLEGLAKNIYYNKIEDKVVLVPIAISNSNTIQTFNMSSIEHGGAMSNLGKDIYDQSGKLLEKIFKYQLTSIKPIDFLKVMNLKKPNHIKIDVDGIEYMILSGLEEIFDDVKSILIEVDRNFKDEMAKIKNLLQKNNFILQKNFKNNLKISSSQFNQIWIKKND